jgi:hypothetical protein
MAFNDQDHPFYRPRWRRIAIVASTALWAVFESSYAKDGFWTVIALAVFVYAWYTFIYTWKDKPPA